MEISATSARPNELVIKINSSLLLLSPRCRPTAPTILEEEEVSSNVDDISHDNQDVDKCNGDDIAGDDDEQDAASFTELSFPVPMIAVNGQPAISPPLITTMNINRSVRPKLKKQPSASENYEDRDTVIDIAEDYQNFDMKRDFYRPETAPLKDDADTEENVDVSAFSAQVKSHVDVARCPSVEKEGSVNGLWMKHLDPTKRSRKLSNAVDPTCEDPPSNQPAHRTSSNDSKDAFETIEESCSPRRPSDLCLEQTLTSVLRNVSRRSSHNDPSFGFDLCGIPEEGGTELQDCPLPVDRVGNAIRDVIENMPGSRRGSSARSSVCGSRRGSGVKPSVAAAVDALLYDKFLQFSREVRSVDWAILLQALSFYKYFTFTAH